MGFGVQMRSRFGLSLLFEVVLKSIDKQSGCAKSWNTACKQINTTCARGQVSRPNRYLGGVSEVLRGVILQNYGNVVMYGMDQDLEI